MVEDNFSFWTEIQRYEDQLAEDPASYCFAPLAELYRKLGLLDDAIAVARKGCEKHPDHPGGFLVLGIACNEKGLMMEARRALERVLDLNPENIVALKLLGQIYAEMGETALARTVLEQALARSPDDLECTLLLRSITASPQIEEDELEEVELIEELTDEVEEFETLDQSQQPKESEEFEGLEELEDIFELDELVELEEFEELEAEPLEEPPSLQEQEPPGKAEELTEYQARTVAPQPKDPFSTATLAELYVSQGFTEKALGVYRDLLVIEPGNVSYQKRIAELEEVAAQQSASVTPIVEGEEPGSEETVETVEKLSGWLENIRSRRHGL